MDERSDCFAGFEDLLVHVVAKVIIAAVRIARFGSVIPRHGFKNGIRLESRGCIVEPHQIMALHLDRVPKHREFVSDRF